MDRVGHDALQRHDVIELIVAEAPALDDSARLRMRVGHLAGAAKRLVVGDVGGEAAQHRRHAQLFDRQSELVQRGRVGEPLAMRSVEVDGGELREHRGGVLQALAEVVDGHHVASAVGHDHA
eukprot:4800002-Pleurochrysis_carterae.AAC.3